MILVDLLDEGAVAVEHRLNLPEIVGEGGPHRRIAVGLFSGGGVRGGAAVVVHARLSGGGGGGGGSR